MRSSMGVLVVLPEVFVMETVWGEVNGKRNMKLRWE